MRESLITLGLVLFIAGLTWPWIVGLGLGQLPGDIRIERPGLTFYFPLATGILISIVLSLLLTLITWLWRR